MLRAYCEAHDMACQAQEALQRDGLFVETAAGGIKQHPAMAAKTSAVSQMSQLAMRLKICSSASRGQSKDEGTEKAKSPRSDLMFGGKGA